MVWLVNRNASGSVLRGGLRESESENAVLHARLHLIGLCATGEGKGPRELAITSLADGVTSVAAGLGGGLGLAADSETVVMDVDIDVILFQTREVDGRHVFVVADLFDVHLGSERLRNGRGGFHSSPAAEGWGITRLIPVAKGVVKFVEDQDNGSPLAFAYCIFDTHKP